MLTGNASRRFVLEDCNLGMTGGDATAEFECSDRRLEVLVRAGKLYLVTGCEHLAKFTG